MMHLNICPSSPEETRSDTTALRETEHCRPFDSNTTGVRLLPAIFAVLRKCAGSSSKSSESTPTSFNSIRQKPATSVRREILCTRFPTAQIPPPQFRQIDNVRMSRDHCGIAPTSDQKRIIVYWRLRRRVRPNTCTDSGKREQYFQRICAEQSFEADTQPRHASVLLQPQCERIHFEITKRAWCIIGPPDIGSLQRNERPTGRYP